MLRRAPLLLVLWLICEIGFLIWVERLTSWMFVLLWLAGAIVLGTLILRRWGLGSVLRASPTSGRKPASLWDGLLLATSGCLLIFPGMLSDVLALLLLAPPVRSVLKHSLRRRAEKQFEFFRQAAQRSGQPSDIIDVESRPSPDEALTHEPPRRPS